MSKKIVITGIGSISPAGKSPDLWDAIINKKNCLSEYTGAYADIIPIEVVGEIKSELPHFFSKKLSQSVSRHTLLAAAALKECAENSKISDFSNSGLLFSSASQGHDIAKETLCADNDEILQLNKRNIDSITNAGACHLIASSIGVTGISHVVDAASCSGLLSIFVGANYIINSHCDKLFSVTGEANLSLPNFLFYNKSIRVSNVSSTFYGKLANKEKREVDNYILPFCNEHVSDRGVISEAGTAILIESLDSATKRKADIIAEIEYIDYTFFAESASGTDSSSIGLKKVLEKYSHLDIDSIYLANTGSYPLDHRTYKCCHDFFGSLHAFTAEPCIGHTGAASGHINMILACKSIENELLPGTKNLTESLLDPHFKLKAQLGNIQKKCERILVVSSGWGGYYASCIIKRFENKD